MGARIMCRAAVALGILLLGLAGRVTLGANVTWIAMTGFWSSGGNWQRGQGTTGTDAIADFSQLNLTANIVVELDTPRTVGSMIFGDTIPSNNWLLDNNGNSANVLTLAVSSGSPTIQV